MFYQQKKTMVSIISGVLLLVAYCSYAFNNLSTNMENIKPWATTMLVFIGIGIVASIIIQIVFHILLSISIAIKEKIKNEQCEDLEIDKKIEMEFVEDEMDKLIALKAMRIGFGIASFGFFLALFSIVMNYSSVIMLNIMFISFCISAIVAGVAQLFFYRSGV